MADTEVGQAATPEPTVQANGQTYRLSELSEEARANLGSLRFAEAEVNRLQQQLAMAQTAAAAYRRAVIDNLPEKAGES
jgi:hypothetical protein